MIIQNNNGDIMQFIHVIIRTILFYGFTIIVFRLMGKKEISQLSIQDLVVTLLIAELVAISIENYDKSIFYTIIPILIVLILELIIGYISLKSNKFRNLIDGKPCLIINNGKINYNEMRRQKYTLDYLLLELRNNGIKDINDVEYAVLENNGSLNIFEYNFLHKKSYNPLPLILDGKIQYDTLKYINKSFKWLITYLDDNHIELEDIFYAFYKNDKVYVIKMNDLEMQ